MQMREAVIVDAVRSPIGRARKGSLASLRPDDSVARVIDRLLDRNPALAPELIEDVYCGCGMPQGVQAFNIARIAVLLSERLPDTTGGVTVSRYCASSLDAIRLAVAVVAAGQAEACVAAGVEWVSGFNARTQTAGDDDRNERLLGGGTGPRAYVEMGVTAVNVARRYAVSREDMDRYAQRSQELAVASRDGGFFDREIVPLEVSGQLVGRDDGPRAESTLAGLAELPERFGGGGITAGNSCPLNDGAAAVLVVSRDAALERGLAPRARIVAAATHGNDPELMGVAPIGAIRKALDRAGMTIADVDVAELNEAFAAQVLPVAERTGIAIDRLNTHGGAIALGHPFGMTGARIMTTLLNVMETDDHHVGLEAMCVAGGQGEAVIVERLS